MTQSLESILAMYQSWRRLGELILINGLVGELILVIALDWWLDVPAHLEDKKRKAFAEMACAALILIGVGIESFAGGRADDVVRRMQAPRLLTASQQLSIRSIMASFANETANLVVNAGDRDSFTFASTIKSALPETWTISGPMQDVFGLDRISLGVWVAATTDDKSLQAAGTLVDELLKDGFDAEVNPNRIKAPKPGLEILVGPRPL